MARAAAARRHDPAGDGRVIPPAPSTIDLHSHTIRSDGLLSPTELAAAAAAVGVRLLSITDHDTLAGVRELRVEGLPAGLELLPGIELNAVVGERVELRESEVHILGLGVDPDDDELEMTLQRQRRARRIRFDRMIARLSELGMPVDAALAALPPAGDEDALGRPRIARALIACGHAASVEDAFTRHLSRGRPAFVPRDGLGPVEAINAVRAAGGMPVLAHFAEAPEKLALVHELIDAGLRGLEVYYRTYDLPTVSVLEAIAADLRLVATGGSDYHGDRETYAEAHAALWVPPTVEAPLRRALVEASGVAA
jgi:predicted metal-dependent phosphoesterase TrpH